MIDFSGISARTWHGKALRGLLRLVPPSATVPILQGRLRGKRWVVGSANHGCWLGSYEKRHQQVFADTVRTGMVVYDAGANVGFYTLLASKLVGAAGRVIAFEPDAANLEYLRRHLALNNAANVEVFALGLADYCGTATFGSNAGRSSGSLSPNGDRTVAVNTLDSLLDEGRIPPPGVIKMDIEGAEGAALRGAARCLRQHRPALIVSLHSDQAQRDVRSLLGDLGYSMREFDGASELLALAS
ncbi:MAG TPA: FkbM family methyltransferase [Terriglobales bacterium]|nr:FkbM family methyltransferase [Terriglobales bacterium]